MQYVPTRHSSLSRGTGGYHLETTTTTPSQFSITLCLPFTHKTLPPKNATVSAPSATQARSSFRGSKREVLLTGRSKSPPLDLPGLVTLAPALAGLVCDAIYGILKRTLLACPLGPLCSKARRGESSSKEGPQGNAWQGAKRKREKDFLLPITAVDSYRTILHFPY